MSTEGERNWTAHIVIATEHAGLKPYFKQLENNLYGCLAQIDDARQVGGFISGLNAYLATRRIQLEALVRLDRNRKR